MWECYNEFVRAKGFTLIELLVAISIAAILSVIGLGSFTASIIKSRDTQRKSDLAQVARALEAYNTDFGSYPDSDALGRINACNYDIHNPLTVSPCLWNRGSQFKVILRSTEVIYLNSMPQDPLGSEKYVYAKDIGTDTYALYAGIENSQDGSINPTGWKDIGGNSISCGTVTCNYKLTESGLAKP